MFIQSRSLSSNHLVIEYHILHVCQLLSALASIWDRCMKRAYTRASPVVYACQAGQNPSEWGKNSFLLFVVGFCLLFIWMENHTTLGAAQ